MVVIMSQTTSDPQPFPTVAVIDADLAATRDPGTMLLDVREYDEWMTGHAPGAVHVPMSQLVDRVGELPRDRHIICVCRSGNRSFQVAAWLSRQGYEVSNLTGGMYAWANHGHPVVNHAGNAGVVL